MYTKILMQIVLLAHFSEYISLPVQAAAQVQVLQQSTKLTADDNNTRQNQKINLQSTVSNSASPASTTTPQTQPDNQQKLKVSNINSDNKNKNKSESVLTEITPEIIKKTADTNSAPAPSFTAITQPQLANQQKPNVDNINIDNKNKNKSESVLAVTTSENIKKGDNIQIPTPEVPSAKGLLNNKDDPQNYYFEEVEDLEDDDEEEEEDYEDNYTANNPIQLSKPKLQKLNPSTTTELENVNNGNINQEVNHLSKSGSLNNNNNVDYNNYGDEYTIEEEEEEEEEEENEAEQQPTYLKKNQIESIKEDMNQRPNSRLSKSGTTPLDSLPNYREEDQDRYYNEDLEQPWQNNENKPHSWSPNYQEEYDSFSQDESSPSSNALNKENPHKYQEEYEGYYNIGSAEGKNKLEQLPSTFNANNEYSNIYETPNYITGESVHNNEFEPQQYIDRQSYSNEERESEESNIDNGSRNTQFSEEEKILNGYKTIKNILYMLHDYASSTFNWIINKINIQIEKVESNQTDKISSN